MGCGSNKDVAEDVDKIIPEDICTWERAENIRLIEMFSKKDLDGFA